MAPAAKKVQPVAARDIQKETGAAKVLKLHLVELLGDDNVDAETLNDAIEGETGLFEVINAAVGQIGEDEAAAGGIEKYISTLTARKSRLEKRAELLRTALMNAIDTTGDTSVKVNAEEVAQAILFRALDKLGVGKIDAGVGTVTVKATPAKVVIVNESEIPSQFWKSADPTLDRRELGDALKSNRDTLADKLKEVEQRIAAGEMSEADATDARERLHAAFPAIPGAELSNGGATIQIRFS